MRPTIVVILGTGDLVGLNTGRELVAQNGWTDYGPT